MPAFAKTSEGIGHGFGECLHLSGEVPPQQQLARSDSPV